MDCNTAHLLLCFSRPGFAEFDDAEAAALRSHLAECPDCSSFRQVETDVDQHVAAAVQAVSVPIGLRERLLGRLEADRQELRWRRWRRRLVSGAIAALVLLSVGLGIAHYLSKPAEIDAGVVLQDAFERSIARSPEAVEDFFKQTYGLSVTAPPSTQFDYRWLIQYDMAACDGKRVPMLLFCRYCPDPDPAVKGLRLQTLRIYVLSSKFKVSGTATGPGSGGYESKVVSHPTDPTVSYLLVYESLEPFQPQQPPRGDGVAGRVGSLLWSAADSCRLCSQSSAD